MRGPGQLGEFLQARRARMRPQDVGLPVGDRRRVPGLRREELAALAGISTSYYTRLEQGQSRGASPAVLAAIATALRLDRDEHDHLTRLAALANRRTPTARPKPEQAGPAVHDLLHLMADVPAIVQGRRSDILAWNRLGHALLAGHLDPAIPEHRTDRPNMARIIFLDEHSRELYVDWPRKARAMVGHLRLAVGRHPDDALLAALIGELSMKSPDFAAMWADHRIRPCDAADYELRHPLVGRITLTQQTLDIARTPEQTLIAMTAPPGSPSHHALELLRLAAAETGRPAEVSPSPR